MNCKCHFFISFSFIFFFLDIPLFQLFTMASSLYVLN